MREFIDKTYLQSKEGAFDEPGLGLPIGPEWTSDDLKKARGMPKKVAKSVIGGARDGVNEAMQLLEEIAHYIDLEPMAELALDPDFDVEAALRPQVEKYVESQFLPEIFEGEGETYAIVRGISQFLTGYLVMSLVASPFAGYGRVGQLLTQGRTGAAVKGILTDLAFFDPNDPTIANLVNHLAPELKNPVLEFLATDPNDSRAENRFKQALNGLVLGEITQSGINGMVKVFKAMRGVGQPAVQEVLEEGFETVGKTVANDDVMKMADDVMDAADEAHAQQSLKEMEGKPVVEGERVSEIRLQEEGERIFSPEGADYVLQKGEIGVGWLQSPTMGLRKTLRPLVNELEARPNLKRVVFEPTSPEAIKLAERMGAVQIKDSPIWYLTRDQVLLRGPAIKKAITEGAGGSQKAMYNMMGRMVIGGTVGRAFGDDWEDFMWGAMITEFGWRGLKGGHKTVKAIQKTQAEIRERALRLKKDFVRFGEQGTPEEEALELGEQALERLSRELEVDKEALKKMGVDVEGTATATMRNDLMQELEGIAANWDPTIVSLLEGLADKGVSVIKLLSKADGTPSSLLEIFERGGTISADDVRTALREMKLAPATREVGVEGTVGKTIQEGVTMLEAQGLADLLTMQAKLGAYLKNLSIDYLAAKAVGNEELEMALKYQIFDGMYKMQQIAKNKIPVTVRTGKALNILGQGGADVPLNEAMKEFETLIPLAKNETFSRLVNRLAHMEPLHLMKSASEMLTPEKMGMLNKVSRGAATLYINMLLSTPATQAVNIATNALNVFTAMPVRGLAARMGTTVEKGEAKAMMMVADIDTMSSLFGAQMGFFEAMSMGIKNWKDLTVEAFEKAKVAVARGESVKYPGVKGSIAKENMIEIGGFAKVADEINPKKLLSDEFLNEGGYLANMMEYVGHWAQMPGKALMLGDEFFKYINFRMELWAQAYRRVAKSPHLKTAADKAEMMADIVNNPKEWKQATKNARKFTLAQVFQQKLPRELDTVANIHPLAKVLSGIVFVRTPTNIARHAGAHSPLGYFAHMGKEGAERDLALGKATFGSMVLGFVAIMAAGGMVSGSAPKNKGLREQLEQGGWQPYSVKLGGHWYQYDRFDPWGLTMSVVADMVTFGDYEPANKDESIENMSAKVAQIVADGFFSRNWVGSAQEFVDAVSEPERFAKQFVRKRVGSVVPAVLGAAARSGETVMTDEQGEPLLPFGLFRFKKEKVKRVKGGKPIIGKTIVDISRLETGHGKEMLDLRTDLDSVMAARIPWFRDDMIEDAPQRFTIGGHPKTDPGALSALGGMLLPMKVAPSEPQDDEGKASRFLAEQGIYVSPFPKVFDGINLEPKEISFLHERWGRMFGDSVVHYLKDPDVRNKIIADEDEKNWSQTQISKMRSDVMKDITVEAEFLYEFPHIKLIQQERMAKKAENAAKLEQVDIQGGGGKWPPAGEAELIKE